MNQITISPNNSDSQAIECQILERRQDCPNSFHPSEGVGIQENSLDSSGPNHRELILLSPTSSSEQERDLETQGDSRLERRSFLGSLLEMTVATSFLRKSFMILLSVFVSSFAALEVKDNEKLFISLFAVCYVCLFYQVFEDTIQYLTMKSRNNFSQKLEFIFDIADKILLIFFVFTLNLQYYSWVNKNFALLSPCLFLAEAVFYNKKSTIPQNQKEINVILKSCYFLQSLFITAKMTNYIDISWEGTLFFLWIELGIYTCYAVFAGLLILCLGMASILQLNRRILSILKTRILGYIWCVSYYALNGIAFMILIGLFQKLNTGNEKILWLGIRCARNLSGFLLIYTLIFFSILKRSAGSSPFQDLGFTFQTQNENQGSPPKSPEKKYQLVMSDKDESKSALLLMISPTYFTILKDGSTKEDIQKAQRQFQSEESANIETVESRNEIKEDGLCYICENNKSDAVLTGCGHGGVCCDCAVKSIEQKNECLQCRKPISAIYKVDKIDSENQENIVKAYELAQVIEIVL